MDIAYDGEELDLVDLFCDFNRVKVEFLEDLVEERDCGAVLEGEVSEFGGEVN